MNLPLSGGVFCWICLSVLSCAMARAQVIPEVTMPLVTQGPSIDGNIGEDEWAQASRIVGFMRDASNLEPRSGAFWLTSDGKTLYLAVRTEVPPAQGILAQAKPFGYGGTDDAVGVFDDDSLELWIDPHRGKTAGDQRYFQIVVNSLGAIYDIAYDPANKQQKAQTGWRVDWELANNVNEGWWEVEIAIPFSSIGATADDLLHPWGMRIVRNWQQPGIQTDWAPRVGSFDAPATMAVVNWDQEAPVVRMLSLRKPDDRGVDLAVEIRNISLQSQEGKIELSHQSAANPTRKINQLYTVPAQQSQVVRITENMLLGDCTTSIKVTSRAGDKLYFARAFNWQIERPGSRWAVVEEAAKAVVLDFGYYPYFNKLKARLDISSMRAKDEVTGASMKVMNKETQAVVVRAEFPAFQDYLSEMIVPLPAPMYGLETWVTHVRRHR